MEEEKQQKIFEQVTDDGSGIGVEVEHTETDVEITDPFDPNEIDIKSRSYTVEQVLARISHNEVTLTPDFQRMAGIWKPRQMSRLIESIMLKIPLPMFYISTDQDDNWLVVDGLQRLTTLKEFITEKKWGLQDLEFLQSYDEFYFDDLPRSMKRRLIEAELFMHIIQPGTPPDVTRTIFRRINTGGLPLSSQEIRHALYQGKSTKLLVSLAKKDAFLKATTHSIKEDRMAGREACLRFLAFYLTPPRHYKRKDLDSFLCGTMTHINNMEDEEIQQLEIIFIKGMNRSAKIFGEHAFRKRFDISSSAWRYPINKALFEVWGLSLAKLSDEDFQIAARRRKRISRNFVYFLTGKYQPSDLHSTDDFIQSISQDTSDPKKVHFRFSAIRKLLDDVLGDEQ